MGLVQRLQALHNILLKHDKLVREAVRLPPPRDDKWLANLIAEWRKMEGDEQHERRS
jgi:hypothetical protein